MEVDRDCLEYDQFGFIVFKMIDMDDKVYKTSSPDIDIVKVSKGPIVREPTALKEVNIDDILNNL